MSYSDSTIGLPELIVSSSASSAPPRADPLGQPEEDAPALLRA